jgi:hypothetical protein
MTLSYQGEGIVNEAINRLPFELHLPGYQFCGPGTKLHKRLIRGDVGINPLDGACKEHDIAYSLYKDNIKKRHEADRLLQEKAWQRVKSSDASLGEKTAAWTVTNIMKAKRKLGMGMKRKKSRKTKQMSFNVHVLRKVKHALRRSGVRDLKRGASVALIAAKKSVKAAGGKKKIKIPRVITIPKTGGFLPLLPAIFAGLSALGGLAGGAAGIAKAVNDSRAATQKLQESQRHNKLMEAIALGNKKGSALYLKPYKKGLGLYTNVSKN